MLQGRQHLGVPCDQKEGDRFALLLQVAPQLLAHLACLRTVAAQ